MKMREKTMKKFLGISIVAMLAVTPMMANAQRSAPATNAVSNAQEVTGDNLKVASPSYVKGAYNAIQGEIRNIATDINVTSVTDSTNAHISTTASVAENLDTLNSAVVANDAKIGTIGNLTGSAAFNQDEAHGDVVQAINTTKAQVNATDEAIGTLDFTDFASGVDTIGEALSELKSSTSATDSKVVVVYSDWNGGGTPYRAAGDYVALSATNSAAVTETGLNPNP